MARQLLNGVKAKLDRAGAHAKTFDEMAATFIESHPYRTEGHFDPKTGYYWFTAHDVADPPDELGAIAGDVIHNFRTALDQLVYDLALLAGHKNPRGTQFPIITEGPHVYRKKGSPLVKLLQPKDRARIRRAQPYQRGCKCKADEHPFAILGRLSNSDKHRLLNPTLAAIEGVAPRIIGTRDIGAIHEVATVPAILKDGTPILRVKITPDGPDPKMDMEGEVMLDIAFRKGGHSVPQFFVNAGEAIMSLVESFAPSFGVVITRDGGD